MLEARQGHFRPGETSSHGEDVEREQDDDQCGQEKGWKLVRRKSADDENEAAPDHRDASDGHAKTTKRERPERFPRTATASGDPESNRKCVADIKRHRRHLRHCVEERSGKWSGPEDEKERR